MDEFFSAVLVLMFILAGLTGYFGYKHGRTIERRELTMALVAQTSDTYYAGFSDGKAACTNGVK